MKRLFLSLFACVAVGAATESIKTLGESGAPTYNYSQLKLWEAGEQADLTAGGGTIAICKIQGAWTAVDAGGSTTIGGWTTGSGTYISILTEGDARHNGAWDTGAYILDVDGTWCLYTQEDYVRVDGLQIETSSNAAASYAILVNGVSTSDIRISNCILKGNGGSGSYTMTGVENFDADATITVWNCVVLNMVNSTTSSRGFALGTGTCKVYNNTLDGNYTGIYSSSSVVAVNNIVNDSGVDSLSYIGTFNSPTDYNATDGTDAIGVGSNNKTEAVFSFVNEATGDFHLQSGDTGAKNSGTSDPGSGLFSTDIDGQTRDANWDIGADEYVAVGGPSPQVIIITIQ